MSATGNRLAARTRPSPSTCSPAACSAWSSRWKRPSAVSVGLCLAHVACDKRPWLEGLNVEMDWPMSGKPRLLYLDNAAEFKSEALRRGCEQHGIRLDYRPLGQPHYGGIVERIIGTAMQMIHDELPGTTFSTLTSAATTIPKTRPP